MNKIMQARRLATSGRPRAQLELGWLLVELGEYAKAYRWMALAMDAGVEEAIEATEVLEASEKITYDEIRQAYFDIACWCEDGEVVPLNVPAAYRLFEVAEAMGDERATARLHRWR